MERSILSDFETFNEFPDKYLKITTDSNCYYVKKDEKSYLARRNVDYISWDGVSTITTSASFFDILNGDLILKTITEETDTERRLYSDGAVVQPFNEFIDLEGHDERYFSKEDVKKLLNYLNPKAYQKEKRA